MTEQPGQITQAGISAARTRRPGMARAAARARACATAARPAASWLAGHPEAAVPGVAACLGGFAGWIVTGPAGLAGHAISAVIAAAVSALIAWLAVLRIRSGRRGPARARMTGVTGVTGGGNTSLHRMAAAQAAARLGLPPQPPRPQGVPGALRVVNVILAALDPGPEQVRAADPGSMPVRWDTSGWRDQDRNLPGHRADKMRHICGLVRGSARDLGVLHQLPQLLLVADDGAVIELFGGYGTGRTGTATAAADATPSAAAAAGA
jgi:hypothetical protein